MAPDGSSLMRVLAGDALGPPPIWIMRQAGRYLPEYRRAREKAGSFLDLCFNPELASEVTLQPVSRFGLDAAILFSDILVIPYALGQDLRFVEGEGPVLSSIPDLSIVDLEAAVARLAPIMQTIRIVRAALPIDRALIGFCGAPWTVATYMLAGRGGQEQLPARRMALADPQSLQRLIDVLVDISARYLLAQIRAGADVVKIFDSWAGVLDGEGFRRWAVEPVRAIVEQVKTEAPRTPVIAFPKGAGARLGAYAQATGVDAVGVDWSTPMQAARDMVPASIVLQGNLDPLRLAVGGSALDEGVGAILEAMRGRRHIFNLGHGITPDTPPENVTRLVERVRGSG